MNEYELTNGFQEVTSDEVNVMPFKAKERLHPKFWKNGKLDSRIRLQLLDIADDFIKQLNIRWVKPSDIVLTGSIANYNWSEFSDVDVHVVMDYKEVYDKTEFVEEYFKDKKDLWNESHEKLTIYGLPVEMYVEDLNNPAKSSGVYSLNTNEWLKEPKDMDGCGFDKEYVKKTAAKVMTRIDDIGSEMNTERDKVKLKRLCDRLSDIFDKLKEMRKKGLDSESQEMSSGNIIWKVVKHGGYIEKIWDLFDSVYDQVNSINESTAKCKKSLYESSDWILDFQEEITPFEILSDFKENGKGKTINWGILINPHQYQKALRDYAVNNVAMRFPERILDEWLKIIVRNTQLLTICSELCGHTQWFPYDEFEDVYGEEFYRWCQSHGNNGGELNYSNVSDFLDEIGFFDYLKLPDGSDAMSDYGLNPLWQIINEINDGIEPYQKLILINRAINVSHTRGDLCSIFIQGGSKSLLNDLSDNITLTEKKAEMKKLIILTEGQIDEITDYNRWTQYTDMAKNWPKGEPWNKLGDEHEDEAETIKNKDYNITPPSKTLSAYKLFYLKDGRLIGPKESDTGHSFEIGKWYNAINKSETVINKKTGKEEKRFVLHNPENNGKSGNATNRPGFHAILDIPSAMQLAIQLEGEKNGNYTGMRNGYVWAIVELADEMGEFYQKQSVNNAFAGGKGFNKAAQKTDDVPYGGTYIPLAQNPTAPILWVVAGSMKVVRLLKDEEVEAKIQEYEKERNADYSEYRMHRKPDFDKDKLYAEIDKYNSTQSKS